MGGDGHSEEPKKKFVLIPSLQAPVHAPHQTTTQPNFFHPIFWGRYYDFPEGRKRVLMQDEITEEQLRQKPHYAEPFNECIKAKRASNRMNCIQGLIMSYGMMEFIARHPKASISMPVRAGLPLAFVAYCLWSSNKDAVRDCQQKMVWNKL